MAVLESYNLLEQSFPMVGNSNKMGKTFKHGSCGSEVGINLPIVEVSFENLMIETNYYIGDRAFPTLLNAARTLPNLL
ncbi:hypothetical protein H5410_061736 [Solanum commersonii]|uniref:Uncharacterized protein n=1 Tax=Solanum commersonii TaxID=4109 RepID=A0A9J5W8U9_SOLCO|nr:hypothetical protein H5410_061736 [Solanum commersonii]